MRPTDRVECCRRSVLGHLPCSSREVPHVVERVPPQLAVPGEFGIATEVRLLAVTVAGSMTDRRVQRARRNDPEGRGSWVVLEGTSRL
jgi:hypothetical protein